MQRVFFSNGNAFEKNCYVNFKRGVNLKITWDAKWKTKHALVSSKFYFSPYCNLLLLRIRLMSDQMWKRSVLKFAGQLRSTFVKCSCANILWYIDWYRERARSLTLITKNQLRFQKHANLTWALAANRRASRRECVINIYLNNYQEFFIWECQKWQMS